MSDLAEILTEAADLIAEKGLAWKNFIDGHGRICTAEALYRAATGRVNAGRHENQLLAGEITAEQSDAYVRAMREVAAQVHQPVASWSDDTADVAGGHRGSAADLVCRKLRAIAELQR